MSTTEHSEKGEQGIQGIPGIQGLTGLTGKAFRSYWVPTILLCCLIGWLAAIYYTAIAIPSANRHDLQKIQQTLDERTKYFQLIEDRFNAIEQRHDERSKELADIKAEIKKHNELSRKP